MVNLNIQKKCTKAEAGYLISVFSGSYLVSVVNEYTAYFIVVSTNFKGLM